MIIFLELNLPNNGKSFNLNYIRCASEGNNVTAHIYRWVSLLNNQRAIGAPGPWGGGTKNKDSN